VFGLFAYVNSPYTLKVEYARKITVTPSKVEGGPSVLDGSLNVEILDASFPVTVAQSRSLYRMSDFTQAVSSAVANQAKVKVPDADGNVARSYDADIGTVTYATAGSTGNDIDLEIHECDTAALTSCIVIGSSGGATDVESATFVPKSGKFYYGEVFGWLVTNAGAFTFTETQRAKAPEDGTLVVTDLGSGQTKVDYTFDATRSALLKAPRFTSKKYKLAGEITLANGEGLVLVRVPVTVTAP